MSIRVEVADLPATLERYPWGYVVSIGEGMRPHLRAVPTDWREGALHVTVGSASRANAVARPQLTMVFPPAEPGGYSLIVDGTAEVDTDSLRLVPSAAVLHRPAIAS
jgi:hypothetical protein